MKTRAWVEVCLELDTDDVNQASSKVNAGVDTLDMTITGATIVSRAVNIEPAPAPRLEPGALFLRDFFEQVAPLMGNGTWAGPGSLES